MLEASELLSPTPKRDAKEEQHFPMKPKGLTLSSFFLALSMRPLGKSRKLASPFSDDAPIYFTLSRLLGHRCRKDVLSLPTSGTEELLALALLSTSQMFLFSSLCSRPSAKEKVGMERLGEDPAPHMLLRSKASPSSH